MALFGLAGPAHAQNGDIITEEHTVTLQPGQTVINTGLACEGNRAMARPKKKKRPRFYRRIRVTRASPRCGTAGRGPRSGRRPRRCSTKTSAATGDPNVNVANAKCLNDWNGTSGSVFAREDDLRYSATIVTPDGQTCTQSGGTSLSLVDNSPVLADSFTAVFLNDLSAPAPVCQGGEPEPPPMPTSKEDCLEGGWADYGFKNQGACIAWVNHNLP